MTEIEEAFVAHWSIFGRWTHGELHEENGVLWFETPIKHLPYNAVIRTRIEGDADTIVADVIDRFRARGVQFFWLVHPTARPTDLNTRLAVEAFHRITTVYWEIPNDEAPLVAQFQREWGPGRAPGHRYLALLDGVAVGKGYLSFAGPPGVAAIYAMTTLPEARGRGVAGGLTTVLLGRAKEQGCRRVVLHSSDMAVGVYRRAGFVERCPFTVFATAPLWSQVH